MNDRRAITKLCEALRDLLDQLEDIGIYMPGHDEGQWADAAGLSFKKAETALAKYCIDGYLDRMSRKHNRNPTEEN